jgi:hypothetical protein
LNGSDDHARAYRQLLDRDFAYDLEFGARLAKRFFASRFLFSTVPARMIQFMRKSPRFNEVMQDLFSGIQPYMGLKERLMHNINGTVLEVVMNFFLHRLVPGENRVSLH